LLATSQSLNCWRQGSDAEGVEGVADGDDRLEAELSALEGEIRAVEHAANGFVAALRQARASTRDGHIVNVNRDLATLADHRDRIIAAASRIPSVFQFDVREHLEREFAGELRRAAEAAGVRLIERDGKLFSFPLLVRIESEELAVRIGRKRERRLRPNVLVQQLAASQRRRERFRSSQRFLQLLHAAYARIAGPDWESRGRGPLVTVSSIYEMLTLLPGADKDYPVEEFARDLLVLDRAPETRTSGGLAFAFERSSSSRGGARPIRAYDEHGREHSYYNLRFITEA